MFHCRVNIGGKILTNHLKEIISYRWVFIEPRHGKTSSGIWVQVRLKPPWSDSLETLDIASIGIILSKQWTTKALIWLPRLICTFVVRIWHNTICTFVVRIWHKTHFLMIWFNYFLSWTRVSLTAYSGVLSLGTQLGHIMCVDIDH